MRKDLLFIQGDGEKGYEADAKLVASLQQALGAVYNVHYPPTQTNEVELDFGWQEQIGKEISNTNNDVILVGHSLGASMLLNSFQKMKLRIRLQVFFSSLRHSGAAMKIG